MDVRECFRILREIKDVSFATVDQMGRPQIRIIDIMLVEEEKVYFLTARGKDFYQELMERPAVAVCAMTKDYEMIRLTGEIIKLEEQTDWIDEMFMHNPVMNDVYPGDSRYVLEPFCICRGTVEYFNLGCSPIQRQSFSFGDGDCAEKGFVITDACAGCGQCMKKCPQNCIIEGSPYKIQQENCLHCGLCREVCPADAVRKKGFDK